MGPSGFGTLNLTHEDHPACDTKGAEDYGAEDRPLLAVKELTEAGEFTGYASVNSKRDLQDDVVAPGAFARTLKHHGGKFKLLWQHLMTEPIGSVEAEEDSRGLKVQGKLAINATRARDAYELIKAGVVNAMSIGYRSIKDEVDRNTGVRTLKEIDLLEISVVTFPANPWSKIRTVKSIVPYQNLPMAEDSRAWDSAAAVKRVREWSGSEEVPTARYRRAFLWFDREAADTFGAYKLPIADVIDGVLTAVPRAIFASAAAIQGARGGMSISDSEIAGVRTHLTRYYKRLDRDPPWEGQRSISALVRHVCDAAPYMEAKDLEDLRAVLTERKSDSTADAAFDWLSAWRGPDPENDLVALRRWRE